MRDDTWDDRWDEGEEFDKDPRRLRQRGFKWGGIDFVSRPFSMDAYFNTNPTTTFYSWLRGDEGRIVGFRNGDLLGVDCSLKGWHGAHVLCVVDKKFCIRRLRRIGEELIAVPLRRADRIDPFEDVEVWGVISFYVHDFLGARRRQRRL